MTNTLQTTLQTLTVAAALSVAVETNWIPDYYGVRPCPNPACNGQVGIKGETGIVSTNRYATLVDVGVTRRVRVSQSFSTNWLYRWSTNRLPEDYEYHRPVPPLPPLPSPAPR